MADLSKVITEIRSKLDQVEADIAEEKVQIQAVIDSKEEIIRIQKAEIAQLQAQVGGSEADLAALQEISGRLSDISVEVSGIVPDEPEA